MVGESHDGFHFIRASFLESETEVGFRLQEYSFIWLFGIFRGQHSSDVGDSTNLDFTTCDNGEDFHVSEVAGCLRLFVGFGAVGFDVQRPLERGGQNLTALRGGFRDLALAMLGLFHSVDSITEYWLKSSGLVNEKKYTPLFRWCVFC